MTDRVSAIIVNYRARDYLEKCLEALLASRFHGDLEILVINNSPEDGASRLLAPRFPKVSFIDAETNLGFGPANNLGFSRARGEYFLLVNPDAFAPPDGIQKAVDYLRQHPRVGMVGAEFVSTEGVHQPSARMFPTVLDKFFMLSGLAAKYPNSRLFGRMDSTWWDHSHARRVDWVVGAFLLVRSELIRALKGFDPRFFLYFEELELCRRIRKSGFEVHYQPDIVVRHVGGVSSLDDEGANRDGKQLTLLRLFSEALYYGKYYGRMGPLVMLGLEWLWYRLRLMKYGFARDETGREQARGFRLHLRHIRTALRVTRLGREAPPAPWRPDLAAYEQGDRPS